MKLGDTLGVPWDVVIHRGLRIVTVGAGLGLDGLLQARKRAADPTSAPPEQLDGSAGLRGLGGDLHPRFGGLVLAGGQDLRRRLGVGQGDQLLDGAEGGFDVFAFLGHDTKIRRQRTRMIQKALKVTSV
ncbi:hypothetical protein [Caulobacter sp. BP25]|uniref:hypothetical protein n=1 Tax=Caulobacter sp. BP25 TaxID=2048900 RepID=UPI00117CAA30